MALPVIAAGAALGALGGMFKKGPDLKLSQYGQQAQGYSQEALAAYRNLVGAGPGAQDVTAGLNASREYANTLNNVSSSGLYDMAAGNRLAEQQFAGQRTAMQQSFQDQLMQANRAAQQAGRSSNDPILRARLAQEQTRQQAQLQANQSAAAVDLGRQSTLDMLSLQGQRVNTLQGLAQQAYGNQQNLFGMGQQAYQTELQRMFQTAGYEQSRGGGLQGALTGAIGGAAAGFNIAQGMQGLANQTRMLNMAQSQLSQPQQPSAPAAMNLPAVQQQLAPSGQYVMASAMNPAPASSYSPYVSANAPAYSGGGLSGWLSSFGAGAQGSGSVFGWFK